MPLLFCVGQHSALEAIQRRLRQSERLLAHLDVSQPDRARDAHNVAEQELWTHANIRVHAGKTHMWNRSVAGPRGAMSCSGKRCCMIRQHKSGGGPLSPRGSRGPKCCGVLWVMRTS